LNVGESNEELLKRQLQPRQPRLSSRDVVTIGVREKPVRSLRVLRVDDLGLKPSDEFLSSLFSSADIDLPSRSA
jgi:ribosome assembly protein YihI (activator of Der GTPase)